MNTEYLLADQPLQLERAAQLLIAGKLVAVPTETVYGLAADASNPEAVARIFKAKGRPANHPLIVHIAHPDDMHKWAEQIPTAAFKLAEHFWPGPLTLLLKKAAHVNASVTGGEPNIALRIPAHPIMQTLLRMTKLGLAAPSANPYQQLSPTQAKHVAAGLNEKIDAILDGGSCSIGMESTILDLTHSQARILRTGPITASTIARCLGQDIAQPQQHTVAISGNKQQHYQPRKPLRILDTEQLLSQLRQTSQRVALVFHSQRLQSRLTKQAIEQQAAANAHSSFVYRHAPRDKAGYAQALYSTLHELDALNIDAIWIERPPQTPEWSDVNDRLQRAASRD